jgi:hypothetical protein
MALVALGLLEEKHGLLRFWRHSISVLYALSMTYFEKGVMLSSDSSARRPHRWIGRRLAVDRGERGGSYYRTSLGSTPHPLPSSGGNPGRQFGWKIDFHAHPATTIPVGFTWPCYRPGRAPLSLVCEVSNDENDHGVTPYPSSPP